MKTGFQLDDHSATTIYRFMDLKGKDAGVNRYRIDCYYAEGLAHTHFEPTAKAYYEFVAFHIAQCYETYEEFKGRKTAAQKAIWLIKADIKELQNKVEELSKDI